MAGFVYLVLAALLVAGASPGQLGDEIVRLLKRDAGPVRAVTARVEPSADPRGLGGLGTIWATVDEVDARRLPLAALAPRPRARSPKGRLDRVVLRATNVRLDTLKASEVLFEARQVTYDLSTALSAGELRVTGIGSQQVTVLLRDGDLDAFAAGAYPELMEPHLTFEDGLLIARGRVPMMFAAFDAVIRGKLAIDAGRRVLLREAELNTGRVELSAELRQQILKRLDPLIDLEETFRFPVPLVWTGVTVGRGEARLYARIDPLAEPEPSRDFQPRERYLR